jgi:hypothetical protein
VDQNPVIKVTANGPREHQAFEVSADPGPSEHDISSVAVWPAAISG